MITNILLKISSIFFIFITLIGIIADIFIIYMIFANKFFKGSFKLDKNKALIYSFLIALTATMGSLFISEILGYEPCKLCWFQRIFMYPLVILYFIAYKKNFAGIFKYTLPMTIIGGSISLYHYMLQMFPSLFSTTTECTGVSCAVLYMFELGFITIPLMAFVAFLGITLMSFFLMNKD